MLMCAMCLALVTGQVQRALGAELAVSPNPEDGVVDVPRDVALEWDSGTFANTHDVYFGTVFDDVNEASTGDGLGVLVSEGQSENTYAPGMLDFDQTYYWRVDEVNAAPDSTVFKGAVWSFTAEPFAIPIEPITATASSSHRDNMAPENTIGRIGLNAMDQHSTNSVDMWLSGMGDANPSIQYEFDQAYKLARMRVWNSNQLIEPLMGLGAKDVTIEYSVDGAEWMTLADAPQFTQATGKAVYTANTIVDFGGALAKFVKITINTGYGMLPQYGLSEVRFLYIPTFGTVDDFESHDDSCNRIFFSWEDGVGHNGGEDIDGCDVPAFSGNGTGSSVGNDVAPFAEKTIVHGGSQAMRLLYDSGVSETTLSFAAQDWTATGTQILSLYFHGAAGNTGQMYIKINSSKVTYDGAAADIASGLWKPWNIDLSTVRGHLMNLVNVTSLTIGIENASGPGTLYIDDILLPGAVNHITPVEPDAANLLAQYRFDGDFSDSAGNFDGTALGDAQILNDRQRGQVLALDHDDDAVYIPSMGESAEITISAWVNVAEGIVSSNPNSSFRSIFHSDGWEVGDVQFRIRSIFHSEKASHVQFRIRSNRVGGAIVDDIDSPVFLTGTADIAYGQWNHVVLTMSRTELAYWVNGHNDATHALDESPMMQMGDGLIGAYSHGNRINLDWEWAGLLDDIRFYDRALSQAEILWLAGKTNPVAIPEAIESEPQR
jgi:hypothetical protein